MKKHIAIIAALAAVVLSTGCASLPTNKGVAGLAKAAAPDKAGRIDQIAEILVGKRPNPVEGFQRVERWRYKGEEINPNDLKLSVAYERDYAVAASMLSPVGPLRPEGSGMSDTELRGEIEAILKAAGVE